MTTISLAVLISSRGLTRILPAEVGGAGRADAIRLRPPDPAELVIQQPVHGTAQLVRRA